MVYVHRDIIWRILVRLPAKSLFRFEIVCKEWRLIINSSDFIKCHTIFNQLYSSCHPLLVRNYSGAPLYSFNLDSLNFINGPQMIDATLMKHSIHLRVPNLFTVAFCNGLILKPGERFWAIYNPLTKEIHKLPQHTPNPTPLHLFFGFGFGYDYHGDDYKVVRIDREVSQGKNVFPTFIYSLNLGSWRRITEVCPIGLPWQSCATFLEGMLYWVDRTIIVALDLRTERFVLLPLPPVKQGNVVYRMASLDRSLICSVSTKNFYDVWVMGDGVNVWNKKLSLELYSLNAYAPPEIRVIAYLKKKEQLVLQDEWGLVWCDIKKNSFKKFSILGFPQIASAQICPGSLRRLNKSSVIEKTSTRKRKRTFGKDTRLKFCVRDAAVLCCSEIGCCTEGVCWHYELTEE